MQSMFQDISALLFDLDGTLVDSMWIWPSIDDEYLARYHLNGQEPPGFHEGMEGLSYREVAQYFLDIFPSLNRTREEIMDEWLIMAHDRYVNQVSLKKGARSFLERMHQANIPMGIATSNDLSLTEDTLNALHIRSLFDCVRSACEVKAGKPEPDIYLLCAKDLSVSPDHCLVFEDIPMGIRAGKNAGMKVCAVEDAYSADQRELKRSLADYYIQDFDDLNQGTDHVSEKNRR